MAGTKEGSLKAISTIKEKYGENFFKEIGSKGGKSIIKRDPETGNGLKGFAVNGKASEAGRKGGLNRWSKNGLDKTTDSNL